MEYVEVNKKNFYISTLIFNVLSVLLISLSYYVGFFGECDDIFYIVLKDFLLSFFEPITLLFVVIFLIYKFLNYKKDKRKGIYTWIIKIRVFNLLFVPIVLLLMLAMIYFKDSSWLVSFILVFYNMTLFNLLYINKLHKIIDDKWN